MKSWLIDGRKLIWVLLLFTLSCWILKLRPTACGVTEVRRATPTLRQTLASTEATAASKWRPCPEQTSRSGRARSARRYFTASASSEWKVIRDFAVLVSRNNQCDRIGRFVNVFANKFPYKGSPNYIVTVWVALKRSILCKKNYCGFIKTSLETYVLLFDSNIRSHCQGCNPFRKLRRSVNST